MISVPANVQVLMPRPTATITFVHEDPTEALVQMLVVGPLAANPGNMAFFATPDSSHYDDFSDGARMARIQNSLPEGTAALTSVLFFDKILRDKKGFASGEGAMLMGGFFKRYH